MNNEFNFKILSRDISIYISKWVYRISPRNVELNKWTYSSFDMKDTHYNQLYYFSSSLCLLVLSSNLIKKEFLKNYRKIKIDALLHYLLWDDSFTYSNSIFGRWRKIKNYTLYLPFRYLNLIIYVRKNAFYLSNFTKGATHTIYLVQHSIDSDFLISNRESR